MGFCFLGLRVRNLGFQVSVAITRHVTVLLIDYVELIMLLFFAGLNRMFSFCSPSCPSAHQSRLTLLHPSAPGSQRHQRPPSPAQPFLRQSLVQPPPHFNPLCSTYDSESTRVGPHVFGGSEEGVHTCYSWDSNVRPRRF